MQIIGKVLVEDWQSDPSFILDIQYSMLIQARMLISKYPCQHYVSAQCTSCLILANISFVSNFGFQPIAFDRSARHRALVPNPDRPGYFLFSCSVKGVGTGLVVFPNATIAFPILALTS